MKKKPARRNGRRSKEWKMTDIEEAVEDAMAHVASSFDGTPATYGDKYDAKVLAGEVVKLRVKVRETEQAYLHTPVGHVIERLQAALHSEQSHSAALRKELAEVKHKNYRTRCDEAEAALNGAKGSLGACRQREDKLIESLASLRSVTEKMANEIESMANDGDAWDGANEALAAYKDWKEKESCHGEGRVFKV